MAGKARTIYIDEDLNLLLDAEPQKGRVVNAALREHYRRLGKLEASE